MSIQTAGPPAGWDRSPLGLLVPPPDRRRYTRPVAVGLFSGAGGMDLGLHMAGFHVAAASEVWISAAITYLVNLARPGVRIHYDTPEREAEFEAVMDRRFQLDEKSIRRNRDNFIVSEGPVMAGDGWIRSQDGPGCEHFFLADVRNLTGKQILDALHLERGDVDLVAGGPPCQGFSAAGQRNVMDPRNTLIFEFSRLIRELQPKTFIMENVRGMLSMVTPEGIPVVDAFCASLDKGGYGNYNALRKALRSMPDARAGLRDGGASDQQIRDRKAEKKRQRDGAPAKNPAKTPQPAVTQDGTLFDLSDWGL